MATNHTEKYGLNLWEPGDSFLREEFNENTRKIEGAIQERFGTDNPSFVMGSFTGDGTSTQQINIGFRPRFVLIAGHYGLNPGISIVVDQGMWIVGENSSMRPEGGITDQGFTLPTLSYHNVKDKVSYYIAFR